MSYQENHEIFAILDAAVGKTIVAWEPMTNPEPWEDPDDVWPGEGVRLRLSDGTVLTICEGAQAGYVRYVSNTK
jgi:hypothetical protein